MLRWFATARGDTWVPWQLFNLPPTSCPHRGGRGRRSLNKRHHIQPSMTQSEISFVLAFFKHTVVLVLLKSAWSIPTCLSSSRMRTQYILCHVHKGLNYWRDQVQWKMAWEHLIHKSRFKHKCALQVGDWRKYTCDTKFCPVTFYFNVWKQVGLICLLIESVYSCYICTVSLPPLLEWLT